MTTPTNLHYINDSAFQAKVAKERAVKTTREHEVEINRKNKAKLVDIVSPDTPFNPLRQLGKVLSTNKFEDDLLTLNPKLYFKWHPDDLADLLTNQPNKLLRKGIKLILPDGTLSSTLAVYHWPHMPEYSIRRYKVEYSYDTTVTHYDESVVDKDGNDLTRTEIPVDFGVAVRGWRDVLLILISRRVVTPSQVLAKFGKGLRSDWRYVVDGDRTVSRI